jgi:hypothetical protein
MTEAAQNSSAAVAHPLYLVFGGELVELDGVAFRDPGKIDVVGMFADHASALAAWKAKAHSSVDNAHMRYFVVDVLSQLTCEL